MTDTIVTSLGGNSETKTTTEGYRCKKCDKPFTVKVEMPMPIDKYLKHIKKLACPLCGAKSKNISLGLNLTAEENAELLEGTGQVDAPESVRADIWFDKGEVGLSSKCIANFMLGRELDEVNWPHDPDDFRRCDLLLRLIPEWKARMPEMASLGLGWTNLAPKWSEVEAKFYEELPGGKAPETYELIKSLTK
jgi:DNA-directed RNA polymerase subunit RPC12/RpoP